MKIQIRDDIFLRISEVNSAKLDIWFIHGFGGSGQTFQEAFMSPLAANNNLYVPDLPGCGVTPPRSESMQIQEMTDLIEDLVKKISANRPIAIVAHSLGGIIGTWLSDRLKDQVKTYINVEGNLTEADAYFCGLARDFDSANEFNNVYKKKVFAMLRDSNEALHRHYASMNFAHPETMSILGKSGAFVTETKAGEEFARLKCNKYYYWAENSTPQQTKEFIRKFNLPNRRFADCGHWPMIDKPKEFYLTVNNDL